MTKTITIAIFTACFFVVKATAQSAVPIQIATHIAQKMKDTLILTSQQQSQIYDINISLHNQKAAVRQQFTSIDSIRIHTQRIEKSRDSLYQTVLTAEKYALYLQKKRTLISAN